MTISLKTLPATLYDEEIALITGETSKKKQIETLKEMRYPFEVNAKGKPMVSRLYFESRMSPGLFKTANKPTKAAWHNFKYI